MLLAPKDEKYFSIAMAVGRVSAGSPEKRRKRLAWPGWRMANVDETNRAGDETNHQALIYRLNRDSSVALSVVQGSGG